MDKQTGKLIARIAENLPNMSSDLMQGWIENPQGLQEFLMGLSPASSFPIWKTIKLGTGLKTADDFRNAFKYSGYKDWGNNILGGRAFTAADKETEVDLVVLSVAELGLKTSATRKDIYKRAIQLGLELCPAEAGPQLRLQYKDQPNDERLLIGMEPIADSGGRLGMFGVECGGDGFWLSGFVGSLDFFWLGRYPWVFVRPRK